MKPLKEIKTPNAHKFSSLDKVELSSAPFSDVAHEGMVIGRILELDGIRVFFGNKNGSLSVLEKLFPDQNILFLKQVHGNSVVPAPASSPSAASSSGPPISLVEADGHFTDQKGIALGIYTADCLPVMLFSAKTRRIAALHAGWRGVASEIIRKTAPLFESTEQVSAWIGPHIRLKSFEVHSDVAQQLQKVGPAEVVYRHPDPSKSFVDLTAIAIHQLKSLGIKKNFVDPDDTLSDQNYFSYRGGPTRKGRLISFICRP